MAGAAAPSLRHSLPAAGADPEAELPRPEQQ